MNTERPIYDVINAYLNRTSESVDKNILTLLDDIFSSENYYQIVNKCYELYYYYIDNYPSKDYTYDKIMNNIGYNKDYIKKEFTSELLNFISGQGKHINVDDVIKYHDTLDFNTGSIGLVIKDKSNKYLVIEDKNGRYSFPKVRRSIKIIDGKENVEEVYVTLHKLLDEHGITNIEPERLCVLKMRYGMYEWYSLSLSDDKEEFKKIENKRRLNAVSLAAFEYK